MKGARYIAETIKGYGTDHVFFVEAILRATLLEMHDIGIKRVLTHSEKAAAYMADFGAKNHRKWWAGFRLPQNRNDLFF